MYRGLTGPVIVALVGALFTFSESLGDDLQRKDLEDLVAHLRELPPKTYDIEILVEFNLKVETEEALRRSVVNIYQQTDDAAPAGQSAAERQAGIDREVKRLLNEQSRPRKMKQRCRYSADHGYRVEQVIERSGTNIALDTGPVETAPFERSFINVGAVDKRNTQYVQLNPKSKIASLYDEPGARISNHEVWTGGTVGWPNIILLKPLFRVGIPDEEEQRIRLLLRGSHPQLRIQVERGIALPDGTQGRRFKILVSEGLKSVETSFDVPAETFNPVWKVSFPGRIPMEVVRAVDGVAQEWIDHEFGAPEGGRRYTLISRKLNCELDPELFAFKAPEGYDSVDHTVNPAKIVYANGRVTYGATESEPLIENKNRNRDWMLIILSNLLWILSVIFMLAWPWWLRRRKRQQEQEK